MGTNFFEMEFSFEIVIWDLNFLYKSGLLSHDRGCILTEKAILKDEEMMSSKNFYKLLQCYFKGIGADV